MFPVTTKTTLNGGNNINTQGRGTARNIAVSNNSIQYTSKVSSIFQIYNTKTHSCGSCGKG